MYLQFGKRNLAQLVTRIKPDLRDIMIFVSDECNCRCSFCAAWGDAGWAIQRKKDGIPYKKHVDVDAVCRFIQEAKKVTGRRFIVEFTGGEPTIHPEFATLVRFLKKHDLPIWMYTNGTRLERYADLCDAFAVISISLDAPPEVHDVIRGRKNTYRDAYRGLEAVLKVKQQRKLMLPFLFANCVLSPSTVPHLRQHVSLLRKRVSASGGTLIYNDAYQTAKFGANTVLYVFDPMMYMTQETSECYVHQMKKHFGQDFPVQKPSWSSSEDIQIDLPQLQSDLLAIWQEEGVPAKKYRQFVDVDQWFRNTTFDFGRARCISPWYSIIIRPDGNVYPCPDLQDLVLGNIGNGSTFSSIWNGKPLHDFRELMKQEPLSVCSRSCCKYYYNYTEPFRWLYPLGKFFRITSMLYEARRRVGSSFDQSRR